MTIDSQGQRKPRRLSREVIYESSWMNLYADKVEFLPLLIDDGVIL